MLGLNLSLTNRHLNQGGTNPLTPLQQATLAAWDMQESSGPLLPAKGDIEIPAFNSPGTTTGPAAGISARNFVSGSSQYFSVADSPVFRAPTSGVKVFRFWLRGRQSDAATGGLPIVKSGSWDLKDPGDEYGFVMNANTGEDNFGIRDAADTDRFFAGSRPGSNADIWQRHEVIMDAENEEVTHISYDGTTSTTDSTSVPGGFFVGSNPFRIGGVDGRYLQGDMTTLAIFDRALTTEERTADQTPRLYADL